MSLKSKKIYEDDTWLERCALVCWLIILLPIVVVCYIISKGLLIMDSIKGIIDDYMRNQKRKKRWK